MGTSERPAVLSGSVTTNAGFLMSALQLPLATSLAASAFLVVMAILPSLRPAERYRRRHEKLAVPRRGARLPE